MTRARQIAVDRPALYQTSWPDCPDAGWSEPFGALSPRDAAIFRAQLYIADVMPLDPAGIQSFTDTIDVREAGRPETVQRFAVTGRMVWTAELAGDAS